MEADNYTKICARAASHQRVGGSTKKMFLVRNRSSKRVVMTDGGEIGGVREKDRPFQGQRANIRPASE